MRWLARSARGKARDEQFVVPPGSSDVTGSRKNKRFWRCFPETQRTLKKMLGLHYIPNLDGQREVENRVAL